jgi:hypothetical protein
MPICVQNCRFKLGPTGYYGADIVANQLLKRSAQIRLILAIVAAASFTPVTAYL